MSRKPNFDVNVDRRMDARTDGRTNGRTEIWTPISQPAISRCDNKAVIFAITYLPILHSALPNWQCQVFDHFCCLNSLLTVHWFSCKPETHNFCPRFTNSILTCSNKGTIIRAEPHRNCLSILQVLLSVGNL